MTLKHTTTQAHRHTAALLATLTLALGAHAADPRQPYHCDNGSRIDISFGQDADGRPLATLHFADETMVLPGVPAASGALYRSGDIRLHTQGDEAIFEDGKGNSRHCRQGSAPSRADAPVAASSFIDITGQVSYLARIALPPDAVLTVRIQDTARAGAKARVLAEQRIELAGQQVPIPFATTVDRDLIGKRARVTATARIEHRGRLLFINDRVIPAMGADGQPLPVELILKPVPRGR